MFQFSIEFDQSKFLETLTKIGAEPVYSKLLARFAQEIETSTQSLTPFKTGTLRRAWFHTPALSVQTLERSLSNKMPYAIFVEEGTRAHEIRPKNKKALSWPIGGTLAQFAQSFYSEAGQSAPISKRTRTTNKLTGKPLKGPAKTEYSIVVKSVHHPGTKPVKMLENTLITLQPFFEDEFGRAIEELWSGNA